MPDDTDVTAEPTDPPRDGARPPGPPRLRRTEADKVIGGVAGGVARFLGVDPVLVRLAFALSIFLGGLGAVVYLVAWVVIPVDDDPDPQPFRAGTNTTAVIGVVLLAVAALVFVPRFWFGGGGLLFAAALVAAGVYLLSQRPEDTGDPGTTAVPAGAPPSPADAGVATDDDPTTGVSPAPELPPPPVRRSAAPSRPASPPPPRPSSVVTPVVLGSLLLLVGGAVAVDLAGWIDVSVTGTFAAALVIVGIGAVASAFVGRAMGLIPIGIVLALGLGVSAMAEPVFDDGVGERRFEPTSLDELDDRYQHGVGELTVDLSALEVDGETRTVEVDLGIGSAEVILPDDVTAEVRAHSGLGVVRVFGDEVDGVGNDIDRLDRRPGPGRLVIVLDVGIGEGKVTRG